MPTRSGNFFSIGVTSARMDSSIKEILDMPLARMDQRLQEYKDQADANCRNLVTRLDRIETN